MKPLPCPFCGELPVMQPLTMNSVIYGRSLVLMCEADECSVNPASSGPTEEIAMERWNHRAPAQEAA